MIATKIVFNGREYGSVEEMPADVRRMYEEAMGLIAPALGGADQNGMPGVAKPRSGIRFSTKISTRFVVNGREYVNVEEMPADVRRLYDQAMAAQGGSLALGGSPAQNGIGAQLARRGLSLVLRAAARSLDPGGGTPSPAAGAGAFASGATPTPAGTGLSASGILLRLAAAAALALAVWWIFRAR